MVLITLVEKPKQDQEIAAENREIELVDTDTNNIFRFPALFALMSLRTEEFSKYNTLENRTIIRKLIGWKQKQIFIKEVVKVEKTYRVKITRTGGRIDRPNRYSFYEGTVKELTRAFSYTLEIGNSWNRKIKRNPTTIKAFITNVQKSYEEQEGSCYSRTYIEHVSINEGKEEVKIGNIAKQLETYQGEGI